MMWLLVVCASFCELGFTVFMKLSDGFKNKKYTVMTFLTVVLPLGVAYAVWTGLGSLFAVLFGIIFFKESRDAKKLFFICLVIAGVIGLRLCS